MQLGEIAKANPEVAIGSLSVLRSAAWAQHECGAARPRCTETRACQTRGRGHAGASAANTIEQRLSVAREKPPRLVGGTSRPSTFAVLGLIASSYLQWLRPGAVIPQTMGTLSLA